MLRNGRYHQCLHAYAMAQDAGGKLLEAAQSDEVPKQDQILLNTNPLPCCPGGVGEVWRDEIWRVIWKKCL